ncbi:MAG: 4-hydroxy-tetrahydrodipicolinate reductase [Candidatus Bathyarchaeia archaeon]|nr:4-hydroxy-tetrahydrodipicolinate reductase [Candidatus Bathyarchaeota archaeon]
MTKICVVGAAGKMGRVIISEAVSRNFEIVGAIESPNNPLLGKTLRELGICDLDVPLQGSSKLKEALGKADVYLSFTTPEAELINIPEAVEMGKRIVMGTTGFTEDQLNQLKILVSSKVPAVFAPNFSIGMNFMIKMLHQLAYLPEEYEISILEAHHSKKRDSPSGTALNIARLISDIRGYRKIVQARERLASRSREELEVLSIRAGGIPGIHEVIIAGPYDMITISHISFSRNAFALGALRAVEWVMKQKQPGVYSMEDVLSN